MGRHGEGESHVHAAGIMLDGRVEEFLHLGKSHDLVKLAADLGLRHAEDGAIEEDVLPTGQFGMEAGANLQQARHAAAEPDPAFGGLGDSRQDLEQRRLASAVAADDPHHIPPRDFEIDSLQRPELLRRFGGRRFSAGTTSQTCRQTVDPVGDRFAQAGRRFSGEMPKLVAFAQIFGTDDGVSHA